MNTAVIVLALGTLSALACAALNSGNATASTASAVSAAAGAPASILVYSRTAGFRHSSIPDGIRAIKDIGAAAGFAVDATEDPTQFTDANLDKYAAVVFLSTTGDVLDDAQQGAFERYIRKGRGYVGVHAASDTEYEWPWYGKLVGGYFKNHPAIQDASIDVCDSVHISTAHLPKRWDRHDEWYNFRENPRPTVHVLATLDESTYKDGGMGADHPIAWCSLYEGGRSWYTAGGHTEESYAEPAFRKHLEGGLRWAAGLADSSPAFSFVPLNQNRQLPGSDANDPATLAIAWPPEGGIVGAGETVEIRLAGTAMKDRAHAPKLAAYLGHDGHAHQLASPTSALSGPAKWQVATETGHAASENTFYLLQATAASSDAGPAYTSQVLLQPRRKLAAHTSSGKGGKVARDPASHELILTGLKPGDFASYKPINLRGITDITLMALANYAGAVVEIRVDAPDGVKLGEANLPDSPHGWSTLKIDVKDPTGSHELFLVVRGGAGAPSPDAGCSLASIEFTGPGVTGAAPVK
jgi:type 1 glutamine amidotransferase